MSEILQYEPATIAGAKEENALILANFGRELERQRIRRFIADFRKVRWAWDGDCGSGALVDALEDDLNLEATHAISSTPRTDAAASDHFPAEGQAVPACLARDLEREASILRHQLTKCFAYLGKEIQRKHLNDSARDGTQALSREVACVLDATDPNH